MAESIERLRARLEEATRLGFRDRLLAKGLARGMIWQDGEMPAGSPRFSDNLTEDLLDYGHTILAITLRLRSLAPRDDLERFFRVAGESIEAAVHRDDANSETGFHRVSAAVAFHLARYSAQAFSILPNAATPNLAPTEQAIVHLLRRRLDELHVLYSSWLLDESNRDSKIAENMDAGVIVDPSQAHHLVITSAFMQGIALFDHAITTGEAESATRAREQLRKTSEVAKDVNAVSHWWTALLAMHLIEELWSLSLYEQIQRLPPEHEDSSRWTDYRRSYIQRLRAGRRSAIELWPSQLEAARRALDLSDDLVVALPTSGGKTRIAELCILRSLSSEKRVVYVTPLRALSAQIERDLAETFLALGTSVSSLYGSAGIEAGDARTLREGEIVVSTPEKLDFALRNDSTIIDDVGLVIFDEGHMLGPGEREVRYEALVQKLLRREDSTTRRIVCLSALFPDPKEMEDLVNWIRQDEPGSPIHSLWRPTRQRFGVIKWQSNRGRLEVRVGDEKPFVPSFVESEDPPAKSRRRKSFPGSKNELALAAAWRFVSQGKDVLIYCSLRISVETLGRLVLKCIQQGVLGGLVEPTRKIRSAILCGEEWLGGDHPAVECLSHGVALHHGGLPRPFLSQVERLLRAGECRLTIASPTLAQGLNLSASVLIVPSIWRNGEIIPTAEFSNVAGRAGRAFVDVEGLIVHLVWDKQKRAIKNWEELVGESQAPSITSGILQLLIAIYRRMTEVSGGNWKELIEYVTGNSKSWELTEAAADALEIKKADWDRDIASLDAAILALLDLETPAENIEGALDDSLSRSLFLRQLAAAFEESVQNLLKGLLAARAELIWNETTNKQRLGYHAAGIGLLAGQFLDKHLEDLASLLIRAEFAITQGDSSGAASAIEQIAQLVFMTAPFRPSKGLPDKWQDALRGWLEGLSCEKVIKICEEGVDLLQDAFIYRLPWAMEAVRVHGSAQNPMIEGLISGVAAQAVESGSLNQSALVLLQHGLNSRDAAFVAVSTTEADFDTREGMQWWLKSDTVRRLDRDQTWPTPRSRPSWTQFYASEGGERQQEWSRKRVTVPVSWAGNQPSVGKSVVLQPGQSGGLVLSPAFEHLGTFSSTLERRRRDIVRAVVGSSNEIEVEFFGPSD